MKIIHFRFHPRHRQAHHRQLHDGKGFRKTPECESNVGMSFTEFSYQLLQGYDFYGSMSIKTANCKWVAPISGAISLPALN